MKRLTATVLLCASLALGQYWTGLPMASIPRGGATENQGYNTYNVSAAGRWVWLYWVPTVSKTLNKFMFRVSAVTGTLASSDIRVELIQSLWPNQIHTGVTFSDSADTVTPSSSIAALTNGDTVMFANTSGPSYLPAGVTADTMYYVCNKGSSTLQIATDSGCSSLVTDFSGGATGTHLMRKVLQTTTTVTSTPTGAAWVEATGFSSAMTTGATYALLIRNMNSTPASNYFTIMVPYAPMGAAVLTTGTIFGLGWNYSTTWGSGAAYFSWYGAVGYRLEYSDGTFEGCPLESVATSDYIAGSNLVGARYVAPAGVAPRIKCVAVAVATNSTPAADMVLKVYTGADGSETLAATSSSWGQIYVASSTSTVPRMVCFSSAIAVPAGGVVRVMGSSTGSSGSYGYLLSKVAIQNSSGSKALVYGGAKYATYNGSAWTYTDTAFVPMAFVLDPSQPYSAGGGSARSTGWVQ